MSLSVDKALRKAQSHIKAGELAKAEELYKQVLSKFPKNKKAIQGYEKLKVGSTSKGFSTPEPPQEKVQELISLYNQGQLVVAIDQAQILTQQYPEAFFAWNILGAANKGLGKLVEASKALKKVTELNPNYADGFNNLGVTLTDQGKLEEAIEALNKALFLKPDYAEAYYNLGNALQCRGEFDKAIDSYNHAIEIKPDYAEAYDNLGITLNERGMLDAAIDCFKQAVKINPSYAEAHHHLSYLKRYNFVDKQITQMKFLYADQKIDNDRKCHLCFALAKAAEDLGNLGEAFAYLKEGNALRKKKLAYNIKTDQTLFNNLKNTDLVTPQNTLISDVKTANAIPIFILGMTRSGTTLVEQIFSSHSKVTGAGELNFVHQFGLKIAVGAQQINQSKLLYFREQYLNSTTQMAEGNLYVTDKMPTNFRFIGLICRSFPEAKIIHVTRDAAATCWSNFKHYFSASGLGFCYNLDDLVNYYQLYKDLMDFWTERYPDRIFNLNYDKLTLDQEYETKKLISHLGLDWQDACLSPQKNKRTVKTASQIQVRQKVYKGSSQKWRRFEPYLNGVFDKLHD